ncbi:MAG: DJ-1/PfpI family protein [Polyangiaceae bacterium]
MNTVDVAIVGYPGVLLSTLYGLVEFFKAANAWSDASSPPFALDCWCHPHTGIPIPDGVRHIDPSSASIPKVIIVPPASQEPNPGLVDGSLTDWLRLAYARGSTIASACVGAYILGEAGVLDGHTITTHWLLADAFRKRFPCGNRR